MSENDIVQVKVKMELIKAIRTEKPELKELPAVYIVDTSLREFLDGLRKEKDQFSVEKKKEA